LNVEHKVGAAEVISEPFSFSSVLRIFGYDIACLRLHMWPLRISACALLYTNPKSVPTLRIPDITSKEQKRSTDCTQAVHYCIVNIWEKDKRT
jgi:hypothetical protein